MPAPRSTRVLPLILASASPRRQQLLRQAGLRFQVCASAYVEGKPTGDPAGFARRTALAKARAVAGTVTQPAWVLAADTVVVFGRRVFGKPASQRAAQVMLRQLSGQTHTVMTGVAVCLAPDGPVFSWAEKTRVRMRRILPQELAAYLDHGEWRDKAGAYGIQGQAGAFVTQIQGCYYNIVGLPLARVCEVLHAVAEH